MTIQSSFFLKRVLYKMFLNRRMKYINIRFPITIIFFIPFFSILTFFLCVPAFSQSLTIFVAKNGQDKWSGRLPSPDGKGDGPLATITAARDRIRQMKSSKLLAGGATVIIHEGTYHLDETLTFGPQDSGTAEYPMVYTAWPGETVIISGGQRITNWKKSEKGLWTAPVPNLRGKPWYFRQLFVNGQLQQRSRHPNTDQWSEWPKTIKGYGHNDKSDPNKMVKIFYPKGSIFKNWKNLSDVEVNILAQFRWTNAVCSLKSVDESKNVAVLASPAAYHINENDPFRVENVLEAIDQPGEWCLNTLSHTVTILSPKNVNFAKSEIVAPKLSTLVAVKGIDEDDGLVRNLHLRGITFSQAQENGIALTNIEQCKIEACHFIALGNAAIIVNNYAQRNHFIGNEITWCAGAGILFRGYPPGKKDVNRQNIIESNHIHHCGLFNWNAPAIELMQSGRNMILNNYIHDMPYNGIHAVGVSYAYFNIYKTEETSQFNFRWNEIGNDSLTRMSIKKFNHTRYNLIEGNVVHSAMKLLDDGGGIYLGFLGEGNVVRNNLVYGIKGNGQKVGIYLDDESENNLVEKNIVYDVPCAALMGRPSVLKDNYLYDRSTKTQNNEALLQLAGSIASSLVEQPKKERLFSEETGLPVGVSVDIPRPAAIVYDSSLKAGPSGIFLSDMTVVSFRGHSDLYRDRQYGTLGPIRLGSQFYKKGLVMHPVGEGTRDAEAIFDFGTRQINRLRALIGIPQPGLCESQMGSVTFEVYTRNNSNEEWRLIYDSGKLTQLNAPVALEVNLSGAKQLRLRNTNAGDNHFGDVCVWASACVD